MLNKRGRHGLSDERAAELDKILAMDDEEQERYLAADEQEPIETTEDPEDEEEKPPQRQAPEAQEEEETPPWVNEVKSLKDEVTRLRSENNARVLREEEIRRQQAWEAQRRAEEARLQTAHSTQDPFLVDSEYFHGSLKQFEEMRRRDMQFVNRVAMQQEQNSYQAALDQVRNEVERDPDLPKFDEVLGKDWQKAAFDNYAKNVNQFGYGLNWADALRQCYRQGSYDALLRRQKESRQKTDEVSKKRDEKKQTQQKNLSKVAKSGSSVQEPREVIKRQKRDYRSAFIRDKALKIIAGEYQWLSLHRP